jgi:predicted dehydrogenase
MPIELFVADRDEKGLRSAGIAESHCSTDARSLFTNIDAAVVVTPAPTHFEMSRELMKMGKDVFVEKPIALVSNEAVARPIQRF